MAVPLNQVINPTNEQRREMIRTSLERAGRKITNILLIY